MHGNRSICTFLAEGKALAAHDCMLMQEQGVTTGTVRGNPNWLAIAAHGGIVATARAQVRRWGNVAYAHALARATALSQFAVNAAALSRDISG
jgi:hypothetical protein